MSNETKTHTQQRPHETHQKILDPGMDLRDYFAAKAMQGIVSALTTPTGLSNADESGVSKAAYKVADAMMEARDKGAYRIND